MGCNWSDHYVAHWKTIEFKKFTNIPKLNEYFTYIKKTFVTDLLALAELISKERTQLLKFLNMHELDLNYEFRYKAGIFNKIFNISF